MTNGDPSVEKSFKYIEIIDNKCLFAVINNTAYCLDTIYHTIFFAIFYISNSSVLRKPIA